MDEMQFMTHLPLSLYIRIESLININPTPDFGGGQCDLKATDP